MPVLKKQSTFSHHSENIMKDYIVTIPLALSQQLANFIEVNPIDLEAVAYVLENLVSDAYYEAEEEDHVTGDLEDNVSVCAEGADLERNG